MNKKEECDIVKDLSVLHINNMLNENNEKFLKKHIESCENCKLYYESMKKDIFNENNKEKNKDEIELNHLRKVNKKITTLKWILTGIIVLILITMLYFYCKIVYIDSINDMNICKILDMKKNSNNYKLVHKFCQTNNQTNESTIYEMVHYYKDGKHKEVVYSIIDGERKEENIKFIEDDAYEKTTVFHDLKQIDTTTQNIIEERKGDSLNIIISSVMLNDAGIGRLGLKTRTEYFDKKECFVVSDSYNGTYRENYIEKETGNLIRVVSGSENVYTEELFSLTENVVTDEDVDISILETEQYKDYERKIVENNLDETMKEIYEKSFGQ